jgi:hypothetical protein
MPTAGGHPLQIARLSAGAVSASAATSRRPRRRPIYDRIVGRVPDPGDMEAYGSYLLHCLIGSVIWTAIKAEACA